MNSNQTVYPMVRTVRSSRAASFGRSQALHLVHRGATLRFYARLDDIFKLTLVRRLRTPTLSSTTRPAGATHPGSGGLTAATPRHVLETWPTDHPRGESLAIIAQAVSCILEATGEIVEIAQLVCHLAQSG